MTVPFLIPEDVVVASKRGNGHAVTNLLSHRLGLHRRSESVKGGVYEHTGFPERYNNVDNWEWRARRPRRRPLRLAPATARLAVVGVNLVVAAAA